MSAVWAVVPAAGKGERFGAQIPKQYSLLAGQALVERSLDTLLQSGLFAAIVVPISSDDQRFATLSIATRPEILPVEGGASRAESVLCGLQHLHGKANADDWVFVHDAARPLVTQEDLQALHKAQQKAEAGVILAQRISDTVKRTVYSDTDASLATVCKTIDRSALWLAQTPQMIRFGVLLTCLERLQSDGKLDQVTDEASALEAFGYPVQLVAGSRQNIKLTVAEDHALAEAIIASRRPGQPS